ncbi:MAG: lysophospholipid acyltransferase family protein [Deferrisomatales bacterium]
MTAFDRDSYSTPPDRPLAPLARWCPWPRVSFYVPVAAIVWRSSREARSGVYDDARWVASSLGIVEAMEGVGMRLHVEGLDHVRRVEGPVVFVGNHMSTLETFVLPGLLQPIKPITFVVKESLVRVPVFGPIMRSRDPITVGRANPREDLAAVLRGGAERLARGISVVVFPQTTRSSTFDPARFNSIGVKLAVRAGVPVVPVALQTDAWGTGKWLKDFGPVDPSRPVRFRFGPPIRPEGRGTDAHRATVEFIQGALEEWAGG